MLTMKYISSGNICRICKGKTFPIVNRIHDSRFGVPGEYSAVECQRCGTLSTVPIPTTRELSRLYKRYYNFGGSGKGRYERIREAFHRSVIYRIWLKIDGDIAFQGVRRSGQIARGPEGKTARVRVSREVPFGSKSFAQGSSPSLLEIGCNEGRNLEIYRRNGFSAEGQEINPVAVKTARARGFRVHAGALEKVKGRFDVVVLANVLEHAPDPSAMLRQVRRLLIKNGQVWITVPNNRSWLRFIFGRKWINWHVPFHLSHFGQRALVGLLSGKWSVVSGQSAMGVKKWSVVSGQSETDNRKLTTDNFIVTFVKTKTPALWVAQSIIAAIFARPGKPTRQLRNPILVAGLMIMIRFVLFPFLIAGNLLGRGDALVVRAMKV